MRPRATLGESGVLNLRQDVFKSKTAAPAALGMGSGDLCWANVVGLNGWTANLLRHDPVVPGKGKDMCYWYFCAACIFCMRIILRWKGLVFLHALPSWTLGLLIWPFTDSEALPKDPTLGNWVVIHTHHNIQPPDLENIFPIRSTPTPMNTIPGFCRCVLLWETSAVTISRMGQYSVCAAYVWVSFRTVGALEDATFCQHPSCLGQGSWSKVTVYSFVMFCSKWIIGSHGKSKRTCTGSSTSKS